MDQTVKPDKKFSLHFLLNAFTIFLSAFLIFQIQPMISKSILPWFGGSSAVWTTSLLFFSSSLLAGYFYVYLISKRSIRFQIFLHGAVLVIGLSFITYTIASRSFAQVSSEIAQSMNIDPNLLILLTLASSVGLPYVILTATSPLVQNWLGTAGSKNHYHLYSISNTGSFFALISYPFFIERKFTLETQQRVWAVSFLFFCICLLIISAQTFRRTKNLATNNPVSDIPEFRGHWFKWMIFSSIPAFMLVAVTAEITQKIAPVPLLWIIPLSLYLLSFIVSFAGFGKGSFAKTLLVAVVCLKCSQIFGSASALELSLTSLLLLLMTGLVFHSKVYGYRPPNELSTKFYLFVALGGSLGTLAASILPPVLFKDLYEVRIAMTVISIVLLAEIYSKFLKPKIGKTQNNIFRVASIIIVFAISSQFFVHDNRNEIHISRDFYGVNSVQQDDEIRVLFNNGIAHGLQFRDTAKQFDASIYHLSEDAALGRAFNFARDLNAPDGVNIGVIGLGTGAFASFCEPQDNFTFYEINPNIEKIARKYFTFLDHCKHEKVEIGDGRILLDQANKDGDYGKYDVLVVDAFSGLSIPTHLLTREAVEIYSKQLRSKKSIIALNLSNKYLDLESVGAALAKAENFEYLIFESKNDPNDRLSFSTKWVLLTRDEKLFYSPAFADINRSDAKRKVPAWTDEKTDILSVLNF